MQPLRSTAITETSSLLRVAPPLCPASVLCSSWVFHLESSIGIGATGSHVPHGSLGQAHAAFHADHRPGSKQVASRTLSQANDWSLLLMASLRFRRFNGDSLSFVFLVHT